MIVNISTVDPIQAAVNPLNSVELLQVSGILTFYVTDWVILTLVEVYLCRRNIDDGNHFARQIIHTLLLPKDFLDSGVPQCVLDRGRFLYNLAVGLLLRERLPVLTSRGRLGNPAGFGRKSIMHCLRSLYRWL